MKTKVVNIKYKYYDVYIGRLGRGKDGFFGNPIILGKKCNYCDEIHLKPGSTLNCYKVYFLHRIKNDEEFKRRILMLKGKTLGCFCKPNPCHGDVIAEWLDKVEG